MLTNLGLAFLLMFPCIAHAQKLRSVMQSGEVLFETSPQMAQAVERAYAERAMKKEMFSGLGRTATGLHTAPMPSIMHLGDMPLAEIKQVELGTMVDLTSKVTARVANPMFIIPKAVTMLMKRYQLGEVERLMIVAGSRNRIDMIEQGIKAGANPNLAFFGALTKGYMDFAGQIIRKYKMDVNAPILGNKTILEILPRVQKEDKRIVWLLENGIDPNLIITTGVYKKLGSSIWMKAVAKGCNPDLFIEKDVDMTQDFFLFLVENGLTQNGAARTKLLLLGGDFVGEGFFDHWNSMAPRCRPVISLEEYY